MLRSLLILTIACRATLSPPLPTKKTWSMDTRAASLYCSTCTFPTDLGPFLPRFSFTEANKDMNAAIRWVKTNGAKFHVDVSTTTSDNKSALRPAAIS